MCLRFQNHNSSQLLNESVWSGILNSEYQVWTLTLILVFTFHIISLEEYQLYILEIKYYQFWIKRKSPCYYLTLYIYMQIFNETQFCAIKSTFTFKIRNGDLEGNMDDK